MMSYHAHSLTSQEIELLAEMTVYFLWILTSLIIDYTVWEYQRLPKFNKVVFYLAV